MLIFVVLDSENEDENERRSTGMHFCIYRSTCFCDLPLCLKQLLQVAKWCFFFGGGEALNYLISQEF